MGFSEGDNKSPGFWFYPMDFERDLQVASLGAQGLWARMLCWMHLNEAHRGFLELPTGERMTDKYISLKVGKPLKQITKLVSELRSLGVFAESSNGTIYCRRMARETNISAARSVAAKSRALKAKRAEDGSFISESAEDTASGFAGEVSGNLHQQKTQALPTVSASASASASTNTHTQGVRAPLAADLTPNDPPSDRFEEIWQTWPLKIERDAAYRAWLSTVRRSCEDAAIACARRYLASDQVARGIFSKLGNWLFKAASDEWRGEWPAPVRKLGGLDEAIARAEGARPPTKYFDPSYLMEGEQCKTPDT